MKSGLEMSGAKEKAAANAIAIMSKAVETGENLAWVTAVGWLIVK